MVTASAESLNSAYTDLYHRVAGTDGMNIVNLAKAFGVNTEASGLGTMRSEVGTALGQASLTVGEQASTFSTLANNGEYVTPHVIMEIQQQKPNAPLTTMMAKVQRRMVLTPAEDSDVDYALSFDTKAGGTAATAGLPDGREIIAKTGTTNLSQSAFFIGSIPQFTLAVGMFTNQQGCPNNVPGCANVSASSSAAPPAGIQTLYGLAGLQGFGGQEPASIWHIFAEEESPRCRCRASRRRTSAAPRGTCSGRTRPSRRRRTRTRAEHHLHRLLLRPALPSEPGQRRESRPRRPRCPASRCRPPRLRPSGCPAPNAKREDRRAPAGARTAVYLIGAW